MEQQSFRRQGVRNRSEFRRWVKLRAAVQIVDSNQILLVILINYV